MSESARLAPVGVIAGGAVVNANVTTLGSAVAVKVLLTANYTMMQPAGFPFRPSFTGAATPQFPQTIAAGTTLALLACEAAALVAAGGGTYA